MIWTIVTTSGTFESTGKKRVINRMITYYGKNHEEEISNIEAIFSESGKELCKNEIRQIEDYIEEEVKQWRKEAKENSEEMELVRQDYLNALI